MKNYLKNLNTNPKKNRKIKTFSFSLTVLK
jgi:hypothetical protein